jgi:ComF family protein
MLRFGLAHVFQDVVAALFPATCRRCGRGLPPPAAPWRRLRPYAGLFTGRMRRTVCGPLAVPLYILCPACAAGLRRVAAAGVAADSTCIAAFEPEPSLFALVHALKYDGMHELAPWFGTVLASALRRLGPTLLAGSILVPVPLHPRREAERGFNQSALLAAAVGRRLGLPVDTTLLLRRRATRSQARLDTADRRANVADAFRRARSLPAGARILLVDDVVTSGSTAAAALAALGCEPARAAILCLCHAGRDTDPRSTAAAGVCVRSPIESSLKESASGGRCTSVS